MFISLKKTYQKQFEQCFSTSFHILYLQIFERYILKIRNRHLFCAWQIGIFLSNFGLASKSLFFVLSFFFKLILFYSFLAALGLRCCMRAFSSCGKWRLLFVTVRGLLTAVASPVAEHGLQAHGLQQLWHMAQQLWLADSRAQAQQLWHTGLVALRHVGSSRTRAQTCVPSILAGGFLTTAPPGKSLSFVLSSDVKCL